MLQSVRRTVVAFAVAAVVPSVMQAQVTYSSFSDFLAGVTSHGIDTFDDLNSGVVSGPLSRSAGSHSYSVAASASPLNLFYPIENGSSSGDWWLSEETAGTSITFSGFGSNVRAIGGSFFATDFNGGVSGTQLRIRALDVNGNVFDDVFSPATADSFFGVRFDFALASLQISAVNDQSGVYFFATADDLVLAESRSTVPEPSSLLLLSVGAAALCVVRVRRRDYR
ncbi:MAG: PEP-CTERM sorting domain-containing protein [Gemmatimonadaceae bacterium]|nr:PEP-CTERM sorting domain-containing protein [Gemmatimonadaceae bacterium]